MRTFKSTNPSESHRIRVVRRNVKRWRSGTMALRCTAAAVLEHEQRFRRVNGYRGPLAPRARPPHQGGDTVDDRGLAKAQGTARNSTTN